MDFDWKALVRTVAPAVASVFGTPAAGLGVRVLTDVLLGPGEPADESKVAASLAQATPEQLLALKKADQDFATRLKELDLRLEEIDADDRRDARARAAAMQDRSPVWIGAMILLVWGAVNIGLIFVAPPKADPAIVGRILGMIDAATLAFLYWLYGSSKGSRVKDDTISRLTG
jgi:hypothetical protein